MTSTECSPVLERTNEVIPRSLFQHSAGARKGIGRLLAPGLIQGVHLLTLHCTITEITFPSHVTHSAAY